MPLIKTKSNIVLTLNLDWQHFLGEGNHGELAIFHTALCFYVVVVNPWLIHYDDITQNLISAKETNIILLCFCSVPKVSYFDTIFAPNFHMSRFSVNILLSIALWEKTINWWKDNMWSFICPTLKNVPLISSNAEITKCDTKN